jgi:hypothetical protein
VTSRARSALLTGIALALAVLFTLYLRQSRSVVVGSDGGSIALQGWDILHGNLLLHGWAMSDVSFYPTELPQYAMLEWLRGLSPDVVHLGGAMTYTIVLLLAALVARGRARGREAAARVLIAAGIMLSPAAGPGTSTLLLTPDHLGSAVPVLLAWLVVDRCPRCWPGGTLCPLATPQTPVAPDPPARAAYVPVAVGALLAWGVLADPLVEITGAAPLVLVCAIRSAQRRHPRKRQPAPWQAPRRAYELAGQLPRPQLPPDPGPVAEEPGPAAPRWFEPSLALAALAAVAAAALISELIRAAGGFALRPVGTRSAGLATLPHNLFLTGQGIAMLFGASFGPGQQVNLLFSSLHLAGLTLFAAAFCVTLRRLFRPQDLLTPALAVAIALNVLLYARGNYVKDLLSSREITEVLPFGAVLAGRVLAGPVLRARIMGLRVRTGLVPVLGAVLAGYAAVLAVYAAQPPVPAENQDLAGWLAGHHLTSGLSASYWLANSVTVDSGGRARVRQVSIRSRRLSRPDGGWGYARPWYQPSSHHADFVITSAAPGTAAWHTLLDSARKTFGSPARTYSYRQYTVLVWGGNLLRRLG